jgi:hypothetical protein
MINEFLIFLKYNAENGALAVGAERSTTQCCKFAIVPELVAWEAVAGSLRCSSLWFVMVTLVVCDSDGLRTPGPSCMPSWTSSLCSGVCRISASCNFGADRGFVFDMPPIVWLGSLRDSKVSAGFDGAGVAVGLRLNENFFGGLNELRVV